MDNKDMLAMLLTQNHTEFLSFPANLKSESRKKLSSFWEITSYPANKAFFPLIHPNKCPLRSLDYNKANNIIKAV